MNLKALRAFCLVAEHGSFSRAAAVLGVAQSALSRQVSALEQELGGRLFYRTGRGASPSELGETLRPRAQSLLAESEQFLVQAHGMKDSPAGSVDLGVVPGAAQPLVSQLTARLQRDFPRIQLRVHEAYSGQVEDWLASGRIEIGLFNRYRTGSVRGAERVLRSEMMLVSARGHPATRESEVPFRALANLPLAGPVRPNALVALLAELAARQRVRLNMVLEGSSTSIIREAVARSGVCTILPRHYVEREMETERFSASRIVKPAIPQTTWLALSTHRPATITARIVARLVREIVPESA
jgi:LysR family nitrogen assimilation transcriptional regulator